MFYLWIVFHPYQMSLFFRLSLRLDITHLCARCPGHTRRSNRPWLAGFALQALRSSFAGWSTLSGHARIARFAWWPRRARLARFALNDRKICLLASKISHRFLAKEGEGWGRSRAANKDETQTRWHAKAQYRHTKSTPWSSSVTRELTLSCMTVEADTFTPASCKSLQHKMITQRGLIKTK